MNRAVVHQNRYQATRVDPEEPGGEVLIGVQINGVRLPRDALQVEKNAELLRARRPGVVQNMRPLPSEDLTCLDVALDELNHFWSPQHSLSE